MKITKKLLAALLCALLAALMGCVQPGPSEPASGTPSQTASITETPTPVGSWAFAKLVEDGKAYTADDLLSRPAPTASVPEGQNFEENITHTSLTFRGDGTMTMSIQTQKIEGSWTQDGNVITFTQEGVPSPSNATLSGDSLTIEGPVFSAVFERS